MSKNVAKTFRQRGQNCILRFRMNILVFKFFPNMSMFFQNLQITGEKNLPTEGMIFLS